MKSSDLLRFDPIQCIEKKNFFEWCIELCKKFSNIPIRISVYDIGNRLTFNICEKSIIEDTLKSTCGTINHFITYRTEIHQVIVNDSDSMELFNSIDNTIEFSYNYRKEFAPQTFDKSLYMSLPNCEFPLSSERSGFEFLSQDRNDEKIPLIYGTRDMFDAVEKMIRLKFFEKIMGE